MYRTARGAWLLLSALGHSKESTACVAWRAQTCRSRWPFAGSNRIPVTPRLPCLTSSSSAKRSRICAAVGADALLGVSAWVALAQQPALCVWDAPLGAALPCPVLAAVAGAPLPAWTPLQQLVSGAGVLGVWRCPVCRSSSCRVKLGAHFSLSHGTCRQGQTQGILLIANGHVSVCWALSVCWAVACRPPSGAGLRCCTCSPRTSTGRGGWCLAVLQLLSQRAP